MPDPEPLPRGFGSYELLTELGRGATGIIYRARHVRMDRFVAIKFSTDGPTTRALQEARILVSMTHPAIVSVYEVAGEGDQVYVVREFVNGVDLAVLARKREIEYPRVVSVLAIVAHAVQAVHEMGAFHNNLIASNVLVPTGGGAKLIGFGRASLQKTSANTTTSPVATDIQALGRMLGEVASSLGGPIPEFLEAVTMKCEAAGTGWGYKRADDVAQDLERYNGQ